MQRCVVVLPLAIYRFLGNLTGEWLVMRIFDAPSPIALPQIPSCYAGRLFQSETTGRTDGSDVDGALGDSITCKALAAGGEYHDVRPSAIDIANIAIRLCPSPIEWEVRAGNGCTNSIHSHSSCHQIFDYRHLHALTLSTTLY
jgi:hypothetical protein